MFRPAVRLIARPTALRSVPRAAAPTRRFLSTAPPSQKSRSWKSLVARLGIAGTIIYYYNTYEVFAEEPTHGVQTLGETNVEVATLPTIDDVARERQRRKAELAAAQQKEEAASQEAGAASAGGVEQLEEEAGQQGAFNPETGEINWDCPCLGGMADGPCGEQFKAAFSCFVHSTEEPKGMDCIEKFKDMQNCFREYPEIYGAELDTDEEEEDMAADLARPDSERPTNDATASKDADPINQKDADSANRDEPNQKKDHSMVPESYRPTADNSASKTEKVQDATEQVRREHEPLSESEALVPKASHDATGDNEGKN